MHVSKYQISCSILSPLECPPPVLRLAHGGPNFGLGQTLRRRLSRLILVFDSLPKGMHKATCFKARGIHVFVFNQPRESRHVIYFRISTAFANSLTAKAVGWRPRSTSERPRSAWWRAPRRARRSSCSTERSSRYVQETTWVNKTTCFEYVCEQDHVVKTREWTNVTTIFFLIQRTSTRGCLSATESTAEEEKGARGRSGSGGGKTHKLTE